MIEGATIGKLAAFWESGNASGTILAAESKLGIVLAERGERSIGQHNCDATTSLRLTGIKIFEGYYRQWEFHGEFRDPTDLELTRLARYGTVK